MGIINTMIAAVVSALILWGLYNTIRQRSELFTPQNLNKSFFTMGILFVILITIVGFAVLVLAR
jgi:uncharacterized membrane protein required for colicin V production